MITRTRFAPSPTGDLHLGSARTALFAWLWARHNKGRFILRIEDTDQLRSTQDSVKGILEAMEWLGLDYDEGPFYQTQRLSYYKKVMASLEEAGKVYRCYCSKERLDKLRTSQMAEGKKPRYDGFCRKQNSHRSIQQNYVLRFATPQQGSLVFQDIVYGSIAVTNNELDDFIVARSDGMPTYNFTVVADDLAMGMTHIIRGEDHISNTPRQIHLIEALKEKVPFYAHVPSILGENGKRLSKRDGATEVLAYRDQGFLSEALLNALIRLGWSYGDQEYFSLESMIKYFDLSAVNRSSATLNFKKLLWLNQQHLKDCRVSKLTPLLENCLKAKGVDDPCDPPLNQLIPLLQPRVKTLQEMADCSLYFYQNFEVDHEKVQKYLEKEPIKEALQALLSALSHLEVWQSDSIYACLTMVAKDHQLTFGKIGQPLRIAAMNGVGSFSISKALWLLGKKRACQRLAQVFV